jgi:eukaryotic-like serine/threonine-protein kinase
MNPLVYLNHNRENQKSSATSRVFPPCRSSAILTIVLLLSLSSLLALSTITSSAITTTSVIPSSAAHEAYAQTGGSNTSVLSYTDPTSGITVQYPSSWEIRDVDPSLRPPNTISSTRLLPPGQNDTSFIDNVVISVNNVSNATLGQYTEGVLAQYKNFSDIITITKSEPSTLAGNPAHSIEYLENHPGQPLKKMQVWSIVGDRVYIVTYAADESEFSQYLADVQSIIQSLQISNGAQVEQQQLESGEQESPSPPFFSKFIGLFGK